MSSVLEAFLNILPAEQTRASTGFINFNCPFCGDTRKRCGFVETPSGGFRIRCFNGGCDLQNPTGWEPGSGLGGTPRRFFVSLGGDLRDLPLEDVLKSASKFDRRGNKIADGESAVRHFPPMELPKGCVPLDDPGSYVSNRDFNAVVRYLFSRGEEVALAHRYYWSPRFPRHLCIPYFHYGSIVGYAMRAIDKTAKIRFFGECPPDYVFNQDKLERGNRRAAIVVEGVMNAIAIGGQATRNSAMTSKQIALFNSCGQRIIVLPDQQKEGLKFVETAERNGWDVSTPDWDPGVKDVLNAVRRYGMLYTVESIVAGASRNYLKAKMAVQLRDRN